MISVIHNRYDLLTETEKRIADWVLASPGESVKMTAKELASCSGTVPSAVVRFCKNVGAKGFSDFKIRLSAELGGKTRTEERLPTYASDDTGKIFGSVFASGIHTLHDTLAMIDMAETEKILDVLQKASRVVFFGVGTSSVIAMDAHYRFAQLGKATAACTDILFMNVAAANLKPGEVAVGISHSGNTKATVNALRRAKKAGASTVAITSFASSRLAEESDCKLIVFSDDKNYPVEAVSARIAHMCIIDALMMALAKRNSGELSKHISERNEVLKEMRYKNK